MIVGKLETLQSDSNALLNEFRKVNEKYLPSEKFRETADKCRETHKTIYSSYAEAKSLCDGMVTSHTVNSKGLRKRLAGFAVLLVILAGAYMVVVQGPSKEYKEVVTAAQEGDTDKLLEYLEDHQSTGFKQLRADCAGELADKAYSESVTSITVGEITGSGMNQSTPIEMTIDNGMIGATVRADMVYSLHGVSFENVESDIQWIDIIDQWIRTHKEYEKKDVKTLYYLSMEFLMGRFLGNAVLNMCANNTV